MLLRAFGYGSNEQIRDLIGEDERLEATLEKDSTTSREEALIRNIQETQTG